MQRGQRDKASDRGQQNLRLAVREATMSQAHLPRALWNSRPRLLARWCLHRPQSLGARACGEGALEGERGSDLHPRRAPQTRAPW
jgi:hypothetical protein